MTPINLEQVLKQKPSWAMDAVAFWGLGTQGSRKIWLGRFLEESVGKRSPWECHPDDEEFLHVLRGVVDITFLAEAKPTTIRLEAGAILIVPAGVWHAHTPQAETIEFGISPEQTRHSSAKDPRG